MNLSHLSANQLHRAADLQGQIEELQQQLNAVLGAPSPRANTRPVSGKRRLSAAGRAAIVAAAKARWAKARGRAGKSASGRKPKRQMSAAARARLSAIAKARWSKVKAAGKSKL